MSFIAEFAGVLWSVDRKLERMEQMLQKMEKMMADLSPIRERVEQMTTVIASNRALLSELSRMIREAADDPAEILAIADQMDAQRQGIVDDIVANTPAAP